MFPRCPLTPDEDGDIDEDAIGEWFAALCAQTIEFARQRRVMVRSEENFEKVEVTTHSDVTQQWVRGRKISESVELIFRA